MPCNDTLQTSHQRLSGDYFNSRYERKCVLDPLCPNMVNLVHIPHPYMVIWGLDPPRVEKIQIFFFLSEPA